MEAFLTKMVKQQNQFLLARIAEDYNKDVQKLQQMYWTPTFYKITLDQKKYNIRYNQ